MGIRKKKYIPKPIQVALTIPDIGEYNGVPIALFTSYGHDGIRVWLGQDERDVFDSLDIDDNNDFTLYQELRREAELRRREARKGYDETRLDRMAESYYVEVEREQEA